MSDGEVRIQTAFLPPAVQRAIVQATEGAHPEEACGLLVGRVEDGIARIGRAIPCVNEAPVDRRKTRFTIDPRRVIEEERTLRGSGDEIVGFYHSHPVGQPVPSSVDSGYMELWPAVVWLIVGESTVGERRTVRAWGWDPRAPQTPREIPVEEMRAKGAIKPRVS